jgi:hypothetical protein
MYLLSIFVLLPVLMNFVAKGTSRRCSADTSRSNASSGEECCSQGDRDFEASHCVADLLDGGPGTVRDDHSIFMLRDPQSERVRLAELVHRSPQSPPLGNQIRDCFHAIGESRRALCWKW